MASSSGSAAPCEATLRREISIFLRAAAAPNTLTFKEVRLAVEKSMGLPEGSLHKEYKSKIKEAVHSVMDEIDAEGMKGEEEEEEVLVDSAASKAASAPRGKSRTHGDERAPSNSAKRRKTVEANAGSGGKGRTKDSEKGRKQEKARSSNTGGKDSEDKTLVCVLGGSKSVRRQVNVRTWKKNILVDIRDFYLDNTSTYSPGKKGMTLNPSQWEALRSAAPKIDGKIRQMM